MLLYLRALGHPIICHMQWGDTIHSQLGCHVTSVRAHNYEREKPPEDCHDSSGEGPVEIKHYC